MNFKIVLVTTNLSFKFAEIISDFSTQSFFLQSFRGLKNIVCTQKNTYNHSIGTDNNII